MRRRPTPPGLAVLAALALTGCTAEVTTAVTVTGDQQASVRATATFTGEAAETITAQPATKAQLVAVFTDRTGRAPEVTQEKGTLVVTQELSYEQLSASGDVLGVGAARLSPQGDDTELTLRLVPATALAQAVRSATAQEPDAAALSETMLRATNVTVAVRFPGGITSHSGAQARVEGDTVTVTRTAAQTTAAELRVVGDPSPDRQWLWGAGAAVVAAALWWARRRAAR